ncbi:MAG: J domain-containing protein [Actinomycetota bacterium]
MSTDRSRRGLTDDDATPLSTIDPHAVLGISPGVSSRELRRAYRRALLAAHPDQGGSREALDLVRSAHDRLRAMTPPDDAPVTASAPEPRPVDARDLATELVEPPVDTAPLGQPSAPPVGSADRIERTAAAARSAAKYVAAQRFAGPGDPPSTTGLPPRRVAERTRTRFEQLLERELVRRSDRRVRLVGAGDPDGAR